MDPAPDRPRLGLTDEQFGAWAGVALHDIASVGGAAKAYHAGDGTALEIATVVKLVRVVWIFPIALAAGWWWARAAHAAPTGRRSGQPFPWFILGFVGASGLRTAVPALGDWAGTIAQVSGVGFQLALLLPVKRVLMRRNHGRDSIFKLGHATLQCLLSLEREHFSTRLGRQLALVPARARIDGRACDLRERLTFGGRVARVAGHARER